MGQHLTLAAARQGLVGLVGIDTLDLSISFWCFLLMRPSLAPSASSQLVTYGDSTTCPTVTYIQIRYITVVPGSARSNVFALRPETNSVSDLDICLPHFVNLSTTILVICIFPGSPLASNVGYSICSSSRGGASSSLLPESRRPNKVGKLELRRHVDEERLRNGASATAVA